MITSDTFEKYINDVRWCANISQRYHLMRAERLHAIDFILNLIQLVGATTVGASLLAGSSPAVSKIASIIIVLCALIQIVGKVGRAASDHERLMEKWSDLDNDIVVGVANIDSARLWYTRYTELNNSHMGRLTVLETIARNETATVLGHPELIRKISWFQSFFRHSISYSSKFPLITEIESQKSARLSAKRERRQRIAAVFKFGSKSNR